MHQKRILAVLAIIFFLLQTQSPQLLLDEEIKIQQAPAMEDNSNIEWAAHAHSDDFDFIRHVYSDDDGNSYVLLDLRRSTTLDDDLSTTDGGYYIAKLSTTGEWLWYRNVGSGVSSMTGLGDSIILHGSYSGTRVIGGQQITSNGGLDIFITSISQDGDWQWTKSFGGTDTDRSGSLTTLGDSIFLCASLTHSVMFDDVSLTLDYSDVVVAKMNETGHTEWANSMTGSGTEYCRGIEVSDDGNLFIQGTFRSNTIQVGSTSLNRNTGSFHITFTAGLDSDGNWLWADAQHIENLYLPTDGLGTALTSSGIFYSLSNPSGSSVNCSNLGVVEGLGALLIAQNIVDGTYLECEFLGPWKRSSFNSITIDEYDNLYYVGEVIGNDFNFQGTTISDSNGELFLAIRSSSGTWFSMYKFGSNEDNYIGGIYADDVSNIVIGGSFEGNEMDLSVRTLNNEDKYDAFVLAFNLTSQFDQDDDGFSDFSDNCNSISGSSSVDRKGCPDQDGDGYSDPDSVWTVYNGADAFRTDRTQWSDFDFDGYGDNWADPSWNETRSTGIGQWVQDATTPDSCIEQYGESFVDRYGCRDLDGDGVSDLNDQFPNDPTESSDTDGDGFGDNSDSCPTEYGKSRVNILGCEDSDDDGYADLIDVYKNEPTQWYDDDNDGYGDNPTGVIPDACPGEEGYSYMDRYGCIDSDGDGYSDENDVFPGESSQWNDSDDDGWGDNQSLDAYYPDAFPLDRTQWMDSDLDGYGDNQGGDNPDACPNVFGTSSMSERLGCPDTDGDNFDDEIDAWPNDSRIWSDLDGDGYSDQPLHSLSDDCINEYGESTGELQGCPDSDGDGVANSVDYKPDNSKYSSQEDWDKYQAEQKAEEEELLTLILIILILVSICLIILIVIIKLKQGNDYPEEDMVKDYFEEDQNEQVFETNQVSEQSSNWPDWSIQGRQGSDGYEWLDYPEGSGTWYYRVDSNNHWSLWES